MATSVALQFDKPYARRTTPSSSIAISSPPRAVRARIEREQRG